MAWVVIIDRSVDPADNSIHGLFPDEQAAMDWMNNQPDELFEDASNAYIAPLNITPSNPDDESKTAAVVFMEGDAGVVQDAQVNLLALAQDWGFYLDDWWFGAA